MIKDLILSTSYDDNKLALNILRVKGYPEYQIKTIIEEALIGLEDYKVHDLAHRYFPFSPRTFIFSHRKCVSFKADWGISI